jgi:hypothetical protein
MPDIKYTYTLNLVDEKEDKILADPILLKRVAEFYNTHKETILLIANTLNEEDARGLIQHAQDEETFVLRGKMVGRESFYTDLLKYSGEQQRRDDKAREEETTKEQTEEVTLESPPEEVVEGSV